MLKKADLKEILKKNPHVYQKDLEEYQILSKELSKAGIQPRGYQLAPPFVRHHIKDDSEEELDHRTINLTASRY